MVRSASVLAYERHLEFGLGTSLGSTTAGDDDAWGVSASYTFAGPKVKIGATYLAQTYETGPGRNLDKDTWTLGVEWNIAGPHSIEAQYAQAGDSKGTAWLPSVPIQHRVQTLAPTTTRSPISMPSPSARTSGWATTRPTTTPTRSTSWAIRHRCSALATARARTRCTSATSSKRSTLAGFGKTGASAPVFLCTCPADDLVSQETE